MSDSSNVIHEDAMQWTEASQGKFRYRRKSFTRALGARLLGFSLYEVPPGASAFPSHFHCANEEALYVLEGEGTLRLGDKEIALRKGHFVTLPPGAGNAHRLVNSSDKPLKYICVSTAVLPDVIVYPDSDKIRSFRRSNFGRTGPQADVDVQAVGGCRLLRGRARRVMFFAAWRKRIGILHA